MSETKCVYSLCYTHVALSAFELSSNLFFKSFINAFVIAFAMANVLMNYVMKNAFNAYVNKGSLKY